MDEAIRHGGGGWWLGVDVGGTFTDAVLVGPGGLHAAKRLTTPDQSQGVLEAVAAVLEQAGGAAPGRFAHGTTVATNALLERRIATTAALFSSACADVLELGRQDRPRLHHLLEPRPEPLVAAGRVVAVAERMGVAGVLQPLQQEAVADALSSLGRVVASHDVVSVAICLLHSWRDPSHEQELAAAVAEAFPQLHVVASHELSRELREFERASTTVVDAALTPVLAPYLHRLADASGARGLPAPVVMQSSGSLDELDAVAAHAARAVLSGPAGGIVAAGRVLASLADIEGVICFDVGGTSCDVATVTREAPLRANARTVAGHPIQLDMLDIHTVGAGGSSIAWVDAGGMLRVGPRSAGSVPGPASYGRGGTTLTVTDAHLLCGHLRAATMQQWGVSLDADAARAAAEALGAGEAVEVARAVIQVATANMAEAARVVSIARGHDPGSLAVLAYGGAGALHACDVADGLGCPVVLVPAAAGVLSAAGLAVADVARDRTRSVLITHAPEGGSVALDRDVADWVGDAASQLAGQLAVHGPVDVTLVQRVRHVGQAHALEVRRPLTLPATGASIAADVARGARRFRELHLAQFGYVLPDAPAQTVLLRVVATVAGPAGDLAVPVGSEQALTSVRSIDEGRAGRRCSAIDLPHGTCLVPSPWRVDGVRAGCLVLTRGPGVAA